MRWSHGPGYSNLWGEGVGAAGCAYRDGLSLLWRGFADGVEMGPFPTRAAAMRAVAARHDGKKYLRG